MCVAFSVHLESEGEVGCKSETAKCWQKTLHTAGHLNERCKKRQFTMMRLKMTQHCIAFTSKTDYYLPNACMSTVRIKQNSVIQPVAKCPKCIADMGIGGTFSGPKISERKMDILQQNVCSIKAAVVYMYIFSFIATKFVL